MKHMKKFTAMLLAVIMVLGMATTAFAANEDPHTITINETTDGFVYEAYQIFKGEYEEGKLTNIEWGAGVSDPAALLEALQANPAFADCVDAADVARVLGENTEKDHVLTQAFAEIAASHLSTTIAGTSTPGENKYTIDVKGDGYYLIKNTTVPDHAAYTRYILKVVENVTVSHKGTVPSVTKKIVEDEKRVDANTVEIGETINYEIIGTIPTNIDDYDTYYYVFTDTMSKGLTYTNQVKITVNGVDVTKYFYSGTTANSDGTTTLIVGIEDILALEKNAGFPKITANTEVILTFTARLNEKANIGVVGNPNDVKLEYSNDPNVDGDGATNPPSENPNEPKPKYPTGETPIDTVISYTTEIELTKVDGLNNDKTLTGAKFEISGYSCEVRVINSEMFVEDENGEYYRLKNGTYTTEAPVLEDNESTTDVDERNAEAYDNTEKKYKKVEEITTEEYTKPFAAEGWVKEDGTITFTGLGDGEYTITELVAPAGYNLLKAPIKVVITSNVATIENPTHETKVNWAVTIDGKEATAVNTEGIIEITVKNTSGSTLPETGGMGTTLFYAVGAILVLAAVVLLVTKRRMRAE